MKRLVIYAKTYRDLYVQPVYGVFHSACSCVVGQQVKFQIGRSIRKHLYEMCGHPLCRDAVLEADLTQIENLTTKRIELILKMAAIDEDRPVSEVIDDYAKLKGFGKWTYHAVLLLTQTNDFVNLSSDAYIRKNLSLYIGENLTEEKCHDYLSTAGPHQSAVCYILWRIKPQSVSKIIKKEVLVKSDFV